LKMPIIFIAGPTASGKTDLAGVLAQQINAEIISCDSMQVYKEPQIITSKPSRAWLAKIPHHFIDIVSVELPYSVYDYYQKATKKIEEVVVRGKNVIVCGGTGMYMKAVLDGIFEGSGKNEEVRARLETQNNAELYRELQRVDPASAQKISVNDKRRLVRALEVYQTSGLPISQRQKEISGFWGKRDIRIFGLKLERSLLYARIDTRVDAMFVAGAIDDVKRLLQLKLSLTAEKIIGIKEIKSYLDGEAGFDEAKEAMKNNTRHYAKRQMTWFKKDKRVEWVDVDDISSVHFAEKILKTL
jgi:tRNA dimethylallyltransferase